MLSSRSSTRLGRLSDVLRGEGAGGGERTRPGYVAFESVLEARLLLDVPEARLEPVRLELFELLR